MDQIKINNRLLLLAVGVRSSGISISRTLGILLLVIVVLKVILILKIVLLFKVLIP